MKRLRILLAFSTAIISASTARALKYIGEEDTDLLERAKDLRYNVTGFFFTGTGYCSGTLITPPGLSSLTSRLVVTAAHCITEKTIKKGYFHLGNTGATDAREAARIEGYAYHPRYVGTVSAPSEPTYYVPNDVAYLILDRHLEASPLPLLEQSPVNYVGKNVTLVGFGGGGDCEASKISHYDRLKRAITTQIHRHSLEYGTLESHASLKVSDEEKLPPGGIYFGDSGGSALIEENGKLKLAGIISHIAPLLSEEQIKFIRKSKQLLPENVQEGTKHNLVNHALTFPRLGWINRFIAVADHMTFLKEANPFKEAKTLKGGRWTERLLWSGLGTATFPSKLLLEMHLLDKKAGEDKALTINEGHPTYSKIYPQYFHTTVRHTITLTAESPVEVESLTIRGGKNAQLLIEENALLRVNGPLEIHSHAIVGMEGLIFTPYLIIHPEGILFRKGAINPQRSHENTRVVNKGKINPKGLVIQGDYQQEDQATFIFNVPPTEDFSANAALSVSGTADLSGTLCVMVDLQWFAKKVGSASFKILSAVKGIKGALTPTCNIMNLGTVSCHLQQTATDEGQEIILEVQ